MACYPIIMEYVVFFEDGIHLVSLHHIARHFIASLHYLDVRNDELTLSQHTQWYGFWHFGYTVHEILSFISFVLIFEYYWCRLFATKLLIRGGFLYGCALWYGLLTIDILRVVSLHFYGLQWHFKCYYIFCYNICSVIMLPLFLVVMEAFMLWCFEGC
jgi:hypothetical protein